MECTIFGFNVYSDANQNYLYVDNIEIIVAPTCPAPIDIEISNIGEDSAEVSWTESASATEWEVNYGEAGFDPLTGGTTVTAINDPEITLTDLNDSTAYDVYVRAVCAVGDESLWVGPVHFRTLCIAGSVPFEEGFEAGYIDQEELAGCWTQSSVSGSQAWTVNSTETSRNRTPRTGDYNIYLRYLNEDWIFYPLELTAGTTYELKFSATQDATTGASVEAAYGMSNDPSAMTNSIIASSEVIDGWYQEFSGEFTPTTSAVHYIGIKGTLTVTPWYLSIDDISVMATTVVDCDPVTDITITDITDTGATISWTAASTATDGYEVNVFLEGADPDTEYSRGH